MLKKILFTIFAIVACATVAFAQNANRNGFFIELGAGGFAFNPPVAHESVNYIPSSTTGGVPNSITRQDILQYVGGVQLNAGLGYRYAFARSWAVELRAESLIDLDIDLFLLKVMPGVRYTTPELGKNISMYTALNAGVALNFDSSKLVGFAGNVELGINFTPKFYVGAFLAMQTVGYDVSEDSMWREYYENTFSGVFGGKLGFRF